jgi:hypothetical protein
MNEDNRRKLWVLIQEAGHYLQNKLPDSSSHPKGRNPYAHIALCVKNKFGRSYKDIEDNDFKKVEEYIVFLKNNPN